MVVYDKNAHASISLYGRSIVAPLTRKCYGHANPKGLPRGAARRAQSDSMGQPASAATPAPYPNVQSDPQAADRVLGEQLVLLARQWVRLPIPILILCLYVGYLVWNYVPAATFFAWAALTLGALIARSLLVIRLQRTDQLRREPRLWMRRLTLWAVFSGIVSGSAAPLFFDALPAERQALLTMVMCCWVAGAIASSGPYPRIYYAFAVPLSVQVVFEWLQPGVPGSDFIAFLLATFLAVMVIFVRDNGRLVIESIRLRFANEELLAQLRAEIENAEIARAKAEEANRAKSRFLASASHDLRQPLHALSLLTGLLNDIGQDNRVREVARHIDQSVQSLDRLFSALLDLSKLDAGVVKPELREIDAAELADRLSVEYRSKGQEKGLAFAADCEPLSVRADPILLERIARNLLENAIRFTESGRVSLRLRQSGNDALLSVSDTGRGIPREEHSRVYEEFYQLHNPERDRTQGLGLGLSIVKRLVDLLGYRIELDSTPGRGTTFTVTLPGAVRPRPGASPQPVRAAPADVAGLKVLVIEDDAEARVAMDLTLRGWGCDALAASSLEEARAALAMRGARADVVLSDFRLAKGADGIAAIEALRAEFGPMPAALLTGDISGDRLLELSASGLPVLHKPVKGEALRELLYRLARGDAHAMT
jgi:signal transduction histidine kinase